MKVLKIVISKYLKPFNLIFQYPNSFSPPSQGLNFKLFIFYLTY